MRSRLAGGLLLLAFWSPTEAATLGPAATVERETRTVLEVLGTESADRAHAAWVHAERLMDFPEIARRALAANWDTLSLAQQWDAQYLMRGFFRRVVVAQLGKAKGEQLHTWRETLSRDYATVTARLVSPDGTASEIRFLVHLTDTWRVYDIQVSGVSMLSNYRAQFQRLWREGGWARVQHALQERLDR